MNTNIPTGTAVLAAMFLVFSGFGISIEYVGESGIDIKADAPPDAKSDMKPNAAPSGSKMPRPKKMVYSPAGLAAMARDALRIAKEKIAARLGVSGDLGTASSDLKDEKAELEADLKTVEDQKAEVKVDSKTLEDTADLLSPASPSFIQEAASKNAAEDAESDNYLTVVDRLSGGNSTGLVGNLHGKSSPPDFQQQQMINNLAEMSENKSDLYASCAQTFVAILTNSFTNTEEVSNTTLLTKDRYLNFLQTTDPPSHFLTAKAARLFGSKKIISFAEYAKQTIVDFEMIGPINDVIYAMAATVQLGSNAVALGVARKFVNILTEDFTNNVEVTGTSELTKPQLAKYYKEYSMPYAEQKADSLFADDNTMQFAQFAVTAVEEKKKMTEMVNTWVNKVQLAKPGAKEGIVVPNRPLTPAEREVAELFFFIVTKGFSNMNVSASPIMTKSQLVEFHKELGDGDAEELWQRLDGNPSSVEFAQFAEALKGP